MEPLERVNPRPLRSKYGCPGFMFNTLSYMMSQLFTTAEMVTTPGPDVGRRVASKPFTVPLIPVMSNIPGVPESVPVSVAEMSVDVPTAVMVNSSASAAVVRNRRHTNTAVFSFKGPPMR